VAEFLLELYVSRSTPDAVANGAERTRLAAEQLTREGKPVRYVRSLFMPEDETCFHLCEAASADDVRLAAERAALPFDRLIETVAGSNGDRKEQ
jgi:hypothetical protein